MLWSVTAQGSEQLAAALSGLEITLGKAKSESFSLQALDLFSKFALRTAENFKQIICFSHGSCIGLALFKFLFHVGHKTPKPTSFMIWQAFTKLINLTCLQSTFASIFIR